MTDHASELRFSPEGKDLWLNPLQRLRFNFLETLNILLKDWRMATVRLRFLDSDHFGGHMLMMGGTMKKRKKTLHEKKSTFVTDLFSNPIFFLWSFRTGNVKVTFERPVCPRGTST